MATTKRYFYEKYKEMVNSVAGPMTVSTFQQTGKLTPQEFIEAGDALVQKQPAWEWAEGDAAVLPFLPANKKYLILRGCVCRERATAMLADAPEGTGGEGIDDWVTTHTDHVVKAAPAAEESASDDAWTETESEDDEKAPAQPKVAAVTAGAEENFRLYDVTVVYDQYYASPRVYLFGYGEDHSTPLSKDAMMEDVYAENREKTVTVDPHPFRHAPCISIHPCRHAETMKRLLERMGARMADEQEEAGIPEAERVSFVFPTYMALFVFLKFISSVVPTISYDTTADFDL